MSEESEHYCQYCGNSNQRVNFAPVGSGLCIFGCRLDCYKQVGPFDTCLMETEGKEEMITIYSEDAENEQTES